MSTYYTIMSMIDGFKSFINLAVMVLTIIASWIMYAKAGYHVLFSAGIYSRMTCSYRGQRKIMCRYSEQAEAHQNSWRS